MPSKNKEVIKRARARWRNKHKEQLHAYNAKYWQTHREKQRKHRLSNIVKVKELHGGRCQICGYNKNYAALVFHHPNDDKIKNVASHFGIDSMIKEAKNCILLCQICHMELHNPELMRYLWHKI